MTVTATGPLFCAAMIPVAMLSGGGRCSTSLRGREAAPPKQGQLCGACMAQFGTAGGVSGLRVQGSPYSPASVLHSAFRATPEGYTSLY